MQDSRILLYIKLFRVKHYIKNLLIFVPVFFLADIQIIKKDMPSLMLAFFAFSLISSAVYIFNDLKDIENDCKHPVKKYRPFASGKIAKKRGIILIVICFLLGLLLNFLSVLNNSLIYILTSFGILIFYAFLNFLYSISLKNYPIIDVVILSSGYVFRLFYGSIISGLPLSVLLSVTTITFSLALSLGKRRNEFLYKNVDNGDKYPVRKVLSYYTVSFLDKNLYMNLTLTVVFYSIWVLEKIGFTMSGVSKNESFLIWSIPILIVILMRYSLLIERVSDGDPTSVLLSDKSLIILSTFWIAFVGYVIYFL
ncbi:MAG: UbiA prenyltransferase family protein [Clostridiales Family XIII bacterium]|jgi:4-hydroxybenzoate polyprenyltransferase|nr:UbiA prenyltransferase family protein [Clostridiales Family XIII bacterium]